MESLVLETQNCLLRQGFELDLHQITGKPDSRRDSIAYFGERLVSVVEDLPLLNRIVFLWGIGGQCFFLDLGGCVK